MSLQILLRIQIQILMQKQVAIDKYVYKSKTQKK